MKPIDPNGWPSIAATVSASGGASAGPSTVPQATPDSAEGEPGWTKRAMRTGSEITDPSSGPAGAVGHNRVVSSPLSGIPVEKRRQLAATLGLFAMLFIAIGAVAATGANTAVVKTFVVIALAAACVLGLMAWGVLHSVKQDAAERRLDSAIEEAIRANGHAVCGCGHEHDPDELHFTDGPGQHLTGAKHQAGCAHDGRGADCAHNCDTCVLAGAVRRPSPRPRRPSPLPR